MFGKVLIACIAITCALANPPPPSYTPYPAPPPPPAPIPPYVFNYAVADAETGVDIAANEQAEGGAVAGSYKVLLPDGRIQTVTYTVEGDSGFVANVQYEAAAAPPPYPKYTSYQA